MNDTFEQIDRVIDRALDYSKKIKHYYTTKLAALLDDEDIDKLNRLKNELNFYASITQYKDLTPQRLSEFTAICNELDPILEKCKTLETNK